MAEGGPALMTPMPEVCLSPAYLAFRERTREATAPAVPDLAEAAEQPAAPRGTDLGGRVQNRATLEHEVLDRPLPCRRSSSRAC